MIYEVPEESSPIRQGDIFTNIPSVELTEDPLTIVEDDGLRETTLEAVAASGQPASVVVPIQPVMAIVGTQECDALRAGSITLFRIRPFGDVEDKAKTTKTSKFVAVVTQHARVNQKWFYLPADERRGIPEKMAADFREPIRIPRTTLERLRVYRVASLNGTARAHFRERLAEFFRRYAYDEWYALTKEEFEAYNKDKGGSVEPFPWQTDAAVKTRQEETRRGGAGSQVKRHALVPAESAPKGLLEFQAEVKEGFEEFQHIISQLNALTDSLTARLNEHSRRIAELTENPPPDAPERLANTMMKVAGALNSCTAKFNELNPRLEKVIEGLTESVEGLIEWEAAYGNSLRGDIEFFRDQIASLSLTASDAVVGLTGQRTGAETLSQQSIHSATTLAATKHVRAINGVIDNMRNVETFCQRVLFKMDERLRQEPGDESGGEDNSTT
jgi:hypothetical protein